MTHGLVIQYSIPVNDFFALIHILLVTMQNARSKRNHVHVYNMTRSR